MPFFNSGNAENLMVKTGQTVSFAPGDDGDLQSGWDGSPRFEAELIGGNNVVKDNATGLMWALELLPEEDWVNHLVLISGRTWAGFNDWKMPNIMELLSIMKWQAVDCRYPEFSSLPINDYYCFSSTSDDFSTYALTARYYSGGVISGKSKVGGYRALYCRSFR